MASIDSPSTEHKYEYTALPHGSIRLLHLLPSNADEEPIKCHLFDYPLRNTGDRAGLYEALSYCWGSPATPSRILIGDRYLPVTASLYAALRQLRDRSIGRVIWADAVCINQADLQERGHQVQSMAEIYSKANRVIVWLGEAEARDHGIFKEILAVGAKSSVLPSDKQEAVQTLLRRPWFQRIWVRQSFQIWSATGKLTKFWAPGASRSGRSSKRPDHVWFYGDGWIRILVMSGRSSQRAQSDIFCDLPDEANNFPAPIQNQRHRQSLVRHIPSWRIDRDVLHPRGHRSPR